MSARGTLVPTIEYAPRDFGGAKSEVVRGCSIPRVLNGGGSYRWLNGLSPRSSPYATERRVPLFVDTTPFATVNSCTGVFKRRDARLNKARRASAAAART